MSGLYGKVGTEVPTSEFDLDYPQQVRESVGVGAWARDPSRAGMPCGKHNKQMRRNQLDAIEFMQARTVLPQFEQCTTCLHPVRDRYKKMK